MGINMTQKVKARFIVFFLLGTGCLLALLWKQNSMLRSLNEQSGMAGRNRGGRKRYHILF